ncbi:Similar to syvn1: E3 ubiquitin-protein ligase synoviolin (Danio rerio), partial [Cotesia congregata]
ISQNIPVQISPSCFQNLSSVKPFRIGRPPLFSYAIVSYEIIYLHLVEKAWYAVTETCLAFTVFRDDFSPNDSRFKIAQHNLIEALKNLVDTIAFSYADLLGEQLTDEHRQRCLRVCEETIEYFNTILLDPGTTIQVRRSVQAHINQHNWFADQFSRLGNQVVGGDLNQGVKWKDLENAFAGNIQTGCVINQRHKDPASFL